MGANSNGGGFLANTQRKARGVPSLGGRKSPHPIGSGSEGKNSAAPWWGENRATSRRAPRGGCRGDPAPSAPTLRHPRSVRSLPRNQGRGAAKTRAGDREQSGGVLRLRHRALARSTLAVPRRHVGPLSCSAAGAVGAAASDPTPCFRFGRFLGSLALGDREHWAGSGRWLSEEVGI